MQPQDSVGTGELALDPTFLGASTTLLNADHHEVYFSGMPEWNGKVRVSSLVSLIIVLS
jgi:hypothetical protein